MGPYGPIGLEAVEKDTGGADSSLGPFPPWGCRPAFRFGCSKPNPPEARSHKGGWKKAWALVVNVSVLATVRGAHRGDRGREPGAP